MSIRTIMTDDNGVLAEISLEDGLTSAHGFVRSASRAIANGWPAAMSDWLNAESSRSEAMIALQHILVQTLASVAGQTLTPEGVEKVRDFLLAEIRSDFVEHARKAANHFKEEDAA